MREKTFRAIAVFAIAFLFSVMNAGAQDTYPEPSEVNDILRDLQKNNSSVSKIHNMAVSPGGTDVLMLEVGTEIGKTEKTIPAILVVANLEGNLPHTGHAAIKFAEELLENENSYRKNTWYIIPMGNPDAAMNYFDTPLHAGRVNLTPWNDDLDENTDEDGPDDLNGDGLITRMRVKHPEGIWIPVSEGSKLMKKAKSSEGEKGIYKIYTEGLDNDDDGKYNEDGIGGTNVGVNFPHLFQFFDAESGRYAGSTPEAESIIRFAFDHPEIAMAFSFGATNFCLVPPRGGRKGDVDLTSIKLPERYAEMFGADPDKSYSMQEIIDMVQPMVPAGMTVDESMVASFLGLGAVVNPLNEDLQLYRKYQEEYKEYLEEKGIKGERFDPEKAKDGSFELWCYYHLGIPVFSMDIWGLPKPEKKEEEKSGLDVDKLEKMTSEEFLELGEEKIGLFLKESGAPEQFSAKRVMAMVEGGQTNPKQMAGMMKQMPKQEEKDESGADPKEKAWLAYSDEVLGGKGFVDWEPFDHPQLGEVEIGGFVPFSGTTPRFEVADSLIELQIPWVFRLTQDLPSLHILETKLTDQGAGVFRLEVWLENESFMPFPIAMGKRNKQPYPAVISLSGDNIRLLSGLKRTPLAELGGLKTTKMSWLIEAEKSTDIEIKLTSKSAGNDNETIKIGG